MKHTNTSAGLFRPVGRTTVTREGTLLHLLFSKGRGNTREYPATWEGHAGARGVRDPEPALRMWEGLKR